MTHIVGGFLLFAVFGGLFVLYAARLGFQAAAALFGAAALLAAVIVTAVDLLKT